VEVPADQTFLQTRGSRSDTEFGGSILGGIQVNEKFYFETKLGLGDVPDWKFVLGWGK
jgi:hypothetical protein